MNCHQATLSGRPVVATGTPARRDSLPRRAWNLLLTWQARAETRHALRLMEPRLLRDIGVSEGDAWQEANKPFWMS